MTPSVHITFDCLPLRSVVRRDLPIDASPAYLAKCERILQALDKHGSHNTYFLHQAECRFQLTNDPEIGTLQFEFEGVVLTDPSDTRTVSCDLMIRLVRETCDWLTEPVVSWFQETVARAVTVEFDRFIRAGDLQQTLQRIEQLEKQVDEQGGYIGMYL